MSIIAATAHVGEAEQHRLFSAGVDAHLPKPFARAELAEVIDAAMSAREAPKVVPAPGKPASLPKSKEEAAPAPAAAAEEPAAEAPAEESSAEETTEDTTAEAPAEEEAKAE